ncbi:globin domain-containing protein [Roseicyclus sp. F158]|uniref:Globin domain-containing protein n=1 Tax=Tropicimonas omnivorans TaxID=3075590 RepID=A0ABU3DDP9_9RHOB|nr:globin domain-containing protein [Roseicyclus sp. F158]MDT0681812.1 globin domain-containing protein [Roseicyclus sp. F158]
MPSSHQIVAVRRSFLLVSSRNDALVANFYALLFAENPGLRAIFPQDMGAQHSKLKDMLQTALTSLNSPRALIAPLKALGARHRGYGAQSEHYPVVASTLIATLKEASGPLWTKEMEEAWGAVLGFVAEHMIAGAKEAAAAA